MPRFNVAFAKKDYTFNWFNLFTILQTLAHPSGFTREIELRKSSVWNIVLEYFWIDSGVEKFKYNLRCVLSPTRPVVSLSLSRAEPPFPRHSCLVWPTASHSLPLIQHRSFPKNKRLDNKTYEGLKKNLF